jgi:carbonic anhydrase/acetyltransferase-like protein (isoleucine patch superfamily)
MIYPYQGIYPSIHPTVFLTDDVIVVGNVTIDEEANIWFGSVVRGDVNAVSIGARTNIQDSCVLHVTWQKYGLRVGAEVTVGHGAVLHGCTIGDGCLVGMGARVMDGAVIGEESLVAAGALVTQHADVPPGMLVAGVPAKVIRPLTEKERAYGRRSARNYLYYVTQYREHNDLAGGMTNEAFLRSLREKGK